MGPHVSDSGGVKLGSNRVKRGPTRRRLNAGEARRGGGLRDSSSDDQMAGGGHLRDAGTRPRRVVAAVGPGMAGVITGVDLGGRWSSGELGVDATTVGKARMGHLRALSGAVSKMDVTAEPLRGRSHAGGEHRRRRVR